MTRYLCCLAVLAVVAVPDWATAYHPCWVPPPCGPVPAYPQQFYLLPPAAPVYEVPLPPPTVQVVPPAARRPDPRPAATPPAVPPAARVEDTQPVRPATSTAPPAPLPPAVTPTPKAPEATPKLPEPPALKLPDPPAPKATPDVPPLILPDPPAATEPPAKKTEPKGSSLVPPPGLPIPPAVPTAAPAPEPEPKRATDSIPPLVLPPDLPSGANGVVPPTTARSSPLAAAPRVQVFPAAGAAAAGALRRVGFFNHTDRPVPLTIEGRAVTLPAKSYLHAQLPPTFRWSEAGGPPRTTTVPADSAGVDVLFGAGSE